MKHYFLHWNTFPPSQCPSLYCITPTFIKMILSQLKWRFLSKILLTQLKYCFFCYDYPFPVSMIFPTLKRFFFHFNASSIIVMLLPLLKISFISKILYPFQFFWFHLSAPSSIELSFLPWNAPYSITMLFLLLGCFLLYFNVHYSIETPLLVLQWSFLQRN